MEKSREGKKISGFFFILEVFLKGGTKPPPLISLGKEEQRFFSRLLLDSREGEPSHPTEEANFSRLFLQSCSFSHYPKFVTIGEGRNEDQPSSPRTAHHCRRRTDSPVGLPLH